MATTTTTLKTPRALKTRIVRIAKKGGRTPHAFMLEALERQAAREERIEEFVRQALAADHAIDEGGEVYSAEDVHAWLERLARGEGPDQPKRGEGSLFARSGRAVGYGRGLNPDVAGEVHTGQVELLPSKPYLGTVEASRLADHRLRESPTRSAGRADDRRAHSERRP
jgi:predicted transcriptional regulator